MTGFAPAANGKQPLRCNTGRRHSGNSPRTLPIGRSSLRIVGRIDKPFQPCLDNKFPVLHPQVFLPPGSVILHFAIPQESDLLSPFPGVEHTPVKLIMPNQIPFGFSMRRPYRTTDEYQCKNFSHFELPETRHNLSARRTETHRETQLGLYPFFHDRKSSPPAQPCAPA